MTYSFLIQLYAWLFKVRLLLFIISQEFHLPLKDKCFLPFSVIIVENTINHKSE